METNFNELETYIASLKENFNSDCDLIISSLTGCIETDSYDTQKWIDKLKLAEEELDSIISSVEANEEAMKSIYNSIYGKGG